MFHGETFKNLKNLRFHEILFYVFLFLLPVQTRILYKPGTAYISWYFNYHLGFFVYLTDILLIACLVSWLLFDKPWRQIKLNRIFWLTLAFFGLMIIGLFHVKHLDLEIYGLFKWIELGLLVWYVSQMFHRVMFHRAAWVLFISGTSQGVLGLSQFHVKHSLGLKFFGEHIPAMGTAGLATIDTLAGKVIRAYGTFPHPNVFGAFMVLGLGICLYLLATSTTKWNSLIVSCGTLIVSLGLFVSFSRLAWVGGIAIILCFLVFHMKHKLNNLANVSQILWIMGIILVASTLIAGLFRETLQTRVLDSNPTSVTDRNFFNNLGLNLVISAPLVGVGAGNYVPALQDLKALEPWQYQPAHNIFIFMAAELGLLGLGLFLMILFEIFSVFRRISWDVLSFTLAVIGVTFLFMSQFDHYFATIQQGRLMFFLILGLIAGLKNLKEDDYEKSN
jgi:O-antigen ligase